MSVSPNALVVKVIIPCGAAAQKGKRKKMEGKNNKEDEKKKETRPSEANDASFSDFFIFDF